MPGPLSRIAAVKPRSANDFIFATGYRGDSCTASGSFTVLYTRPAIGRMDSLGNIVDYKHYILNAACRNLPGDLTITSNGGVITWGSDTSFFALRVGPDLAPLWAKRGTQKGGFQFIKELPGGDLLAGINLHGTGAVLARMSAEGNLLWCRSYIRPRGMLHDAVIESDDAFIITGYTDSTASTNPFIPLPSTFQPKLFMMKLNGAGDVQWCRGYQSTTHRWYTPQWSRMKRCLDGNYVVLANMGYPENSFFYRPILMKTDPNGDTLWTRSFGRSGYDYYTRDLMVHSDGGYVISGGVWGDFQQHIGAAFLFKTDALGHLSCYEQTSSIQLQELFPVDSAFSISFVEGVLEQSAFMVDTIFPFSTYDGCTFTTGMPPAMAKGRPMKAYPNPNTGRFTLEFHDPLMAESYYSVYDALGKLLYQRPLPKGATLEEIDLSRYGRGSYVIRFTSPDEVCHERVVLE